MIYQPEMEVRRPVGLDKQVGQGKHSKKSFLQLQWERQGGILG